MSGPLRVALAGTGEGTPELLRRLGAEPRLSVAAVIDGERAGTPAGEAFPGCGLPETLRISGRAPDEEFDVVFLAGPAAQEAEAARSARLTVNLVPGSSEGVPAHPEFAAAELPGARHIAAVDAITAAALLALAPLYRAGLPARRDVIIDVRTGTDSVPVLHPAAGRIAALLGFGAGIHLSTAPACKAAPAALELSAHLFITDGTSGLDVSAAYRSAWDGEAHVSVLPWRSAPPRLPDPAAVSGTPRSELAFRLDPDTGRLVVLVTADCSAATAADRAVRAACRALGLQEGTLAGPGGQERGNGR